MTADLRFGLAAILVLSCVAGTAVSADPPAAAAPAAPAAAAPAAPAAAAPSAPAAAEIGPERAKFEKLFAEWKGVLRELRELRAEFQLGNEARSAQIKKRYDELLTKGTTMQPELLLTAEKAYAEAPNEDPELANLLDRTCHGYLERDDYENTYRLGDFLLGHKHQDKRLYGTTGQAAYVLGKLDKAEEYLNRARGDGVLSNLGAQFLESLPEHKKKWEREQKLRAAEAQADDLPRVLLKTSRGDLEIELLENEAPNTVANFISLVEKGFYNGLGFHRVLPHFMAQGGCPRGDGTGGPGYHIACECGQPNHREHFLGTLSMAHAGPNTGGSQFFLTFIPTAHLDGRHTVFGRVVKGLEVLPLLKRRDPQKDRGTEPDKILEAKVLRKRPHEYVPETRPAKR